MGNVASYEKKIAEKTGDYTGKITENERKMVMRLRNVKGAREALEENSYVIEAPEACRGKWREVFGNENPLYIEIGMGKGQFLLELAKRHPQINYIGIEMYASVLVRAVQKAEGDHPGEGVRAIVPSEHKNRQELLFPNVRFLNMQAEYLENAFQPGEVDRIYLNFSDPWPKARHWKRRLTSTVFLGRYEKILKEGGILEFKTDNRDLFEFSLDSVKEAGWKLAASTFDLHHDPALCEGNVMTEYEQKFSSRGQAICKLVAQNSRAC